jgi:Fe-Mn family superoxide dismutase
MTLEDLITESDIDKNLYNLAAQTWNHNFYWQSIHPDAGGQPKGMMADILVKNFGSVDSFIDQFKTAAANHFGSGWTWLVKEKDGSLSVISTSDAINPLSNEQLPLLTIDVWEHAYYLDYQEKRGEYINDFVTYMLNWDFAYKNLTQSM